MVHSKPVFEVIPVNSNEFTDDWTEYTSKNNKAWLKTRKELKSGETVSLDELKLKHL